MDRCDTCGEDRPPNTKFCGHCGAASQASFSKNSETLSVLAVGAQKPADRLDLFRRAALLFDELDMGGEHLSGFAENVEADLSEAELLRWEQAVESSDYALALIREFSAIEGEMSSHNPKGQGRMSGKTFPRLGSASSELAHGTLTSDALSRAIELTIHAGYLAALLLFPNISTRQFRHHGEIRREWILYAYQVPEQVMESVWSVTSFAEFWIRFLEKHELYGAANAIRVSDASSAVVNSLSGLFGVGIILAFEERAPD